MIHRTTPLIIILEKECDDNYVLSAQLASEIFPTVMETMQFGLEIDEVSHERIYYVSNERNEVIDRYLRDRGFTREQYDAVRGELFKALSDKTRILRVYPELNKVIHKTVHEIDFEVVITTQQDPQLPETAREGWYTMEIHAMFPEGKEVKKLDFHYRDIEIGSYPPVPVDRHAEVYKIVLARVIDSLRAEINGPRR